MTLDNIIQVARDAGFSIKVEDVSKFERFAALVAAAEREACAKVCDGIRYSGYCPPEDGAAPDYYNNAAEECASAIRARGEP